MSSMMKWSCSSWKAKKFRCDS